MVPAKNNNNLVLVQNKVRTPGQWNDTETWTELKQVWVSISPNRGREVFAADERESIVTHTIRGEFLEMEGITAEMRIVYNDTHAYSPIRSDSIVYQILAVMPDMDHRADIMIQAEEEGRRYSALA